MIPSFTPDNIYVSPENLRTFMEDVFVRLGLPKDEARLTTDVLVEADLRGIDTHGIGRLLIYVNRLRSGLQNPTTSVVTVADSPGTALLDGGSGMGQIVAFKAMELAIQKARETGIAGIAVRNSSHFGFAGYYPLMAAAQDMVGLAFTNARPSICPTFGTEPMLGTNPIACAAPTDMEFPFLFDAATSIIQRGTVELFDRLQSTVPPDLVVGQNGETLSDPASILEKMLEGTAALLPLGGKGEESGGHKGYGLAVMVEILSAAFQNGPYLRHVTGVGMGHFFIAIDISRFLPVQTFRLIAGNILRDLQQSRKEGEKSRIYVPGEKEYYKRRERMKTGIPLPADFLLRMDELTEELGVRSIQRKEMTCS